MRCFAACSRCETKACLIRQSATFSTQRACWATPVVAFTRFPSAAHAVSAVNGWRCRQLRRDESSSDQVDTVDSDLADVGGVL